jgi:hypothetical protein
MRRGSTLGNVDTAENDLALRRKLRDWTSQAVVGRHERAQSRWRLSSLFEGMHIRVPAVGPRKFMSCDT